MIAFYLLYKAAVETSLKERHKFLFYELARAKDKVQEINEELKIEIAERKHAEEVLHRLSFIDGLPLGLYTCANATG